MIQRVAIPMAFLFCLVVCGCTASVEKVSAFGEYSGYSDERFDEWVRTSQYVAMRDGTKLAVDIVRPAVDGVAVDEPFPVVWTHSRYHRNPTALIDFFRERAATAAAAGEEISVPPGLPPQGTVISYVEMVPGLQRLVRHGYVFVAVAVRGSGASFGRYEGLFSPAETRDAYDVMDWIVAQPWSDGNLGMWGASYLGITQYMAASTHHPALKAIVPNVALFDFYDVIYPGGVHRDDMIEHWGGLTRDLDINANPVPTDDDGDAAMRAAAVREHADNWDVIEGLAAATYRDHDSEFAWTTHSPTAVLDAINTSGVAAYHWGGWFDAFAADEFLWFANYKGPQRVTVGPWTHTSAGQQAGEERAQLEAVEHHRWFDHYLKGIDNGVATEDPIRYAVLDDAGTWRWESATEWPPARVAPVDYYLGSGPTGTVASVNDGSLAHEPPTSAAADRYTVDPTTTTGSSSRWDDTVGQGPMRYPDMSANDAKSLTWTTDVLERDLTLTGHPVVTLFVTSSTQDADFHALLEEVTPDGVSHYVTEGVLRASHRATIEPPWNNLGLPYQRSAAGDPAPLPFQPTRIAFDLIPTAWTFNAGNRLRLTVMGADADNTRPVPATEKPEIRVYRDPAHPSRVRLPVVYR